MFAFFFFFFFLIVCLATEGGSACPTGQPGVMDTQGEGRLGLKSVGFVGLAELKDALGRNLVGRLP